MLPGGPNEKRTVQKTSRWFFFCAKAPSRAPFTPSEAVHPGRAQHDMLKACCPISINFLLKTVSTQTPNRCREFRGCLLAPCCELQWRCAVLFTRRLMNEEREIIDHMIC